MSTDVSLARWYPLRYHPVQQALVSDVARIKVIAAGRRSGKTERAMRYTVREAMRTPGRYFLAAPTRDQAKRIFWGDAKLLSFSSLFHPPSESELIVKIPNGSTISIVGLDRPQRMEGVPWSGGVIDEIDDVPSDAWATHIAPALDTVSPIHPDLRAWCWLIGVPDGLGTLHELFELGKRTPGWRSYTWPSSDILPQDVIEAARARMSAREFRQEYEASFETVSGRIYRDYGPENETTETLQSHEIVCWSHDFNYTPLSSCISAIRGDTIYVVGEIVLQSAVARQSAQEFVHRYKDHANKYVVLYGDPSGRAGEKHAQESNYAEIEYVLRAAGWRVERRVKAAAPAIIDRQNRLRARIRTASGKVSLFVNPTAAPWVHRGLSTVTLKPGSTFLEADSEVQHITTALGYMIDYEHTESGGVSFGWRRA